MSILIVNNTTTRNILWQAEQQQEYIQVNGKLIQC